MAEYAITAMIILDGPEDEDDAREVFKDIMKTVHNDIAEYEILEIEEQ